MKEYTYDEFGNLAETGESSFDNEITYTGSITDTSTGLQYMNARFYEPSTGRFISQDSYSGNAYDPWTQHLYSYCGNNPTNFVDPTGHFRVGNYYDTEDPEYTETDGPSIPVMEGPIGGPSSGSGGSSSGSGSGSTSGSDSNGGLTDQEIQELMELAERIGLRLPPPNYDGADHMWIDLKSVPLYFNLAYWTSRKIGISYYDLGDKVKINYIEAYISTNLTNTNVDGIVVDEFFIIRISVANKDYSITGWPGETIKSPYTVVDSKYVFFDDLYIDKGNTLNIGFGYIGSATTDNPCCNFLGPKLPVSVTPIDVKF